MGKNSKISWCDHTFNVWWGCVEVSAGCDHCYAREMAKRLGFAVWGKDAGRRAFGRKYWDQPFGWNDDAIRTGKRGRVFCASMADVMEEYVGPDAGIVNAARVNLFDVIQRTANLDWMLLTKRPQNYRKFLPAEWLRNPLKNVWLGTTVENRAADWRIQELIRVPAAVRFVSNEPAIQQIDFSMQPIKALGLRDMAIYSDRQAVPGRSGIHWVIIGGESGAGARAFDLQGARQAVADVRAKGGLVFVKQLGGHPDKRDDPAAWPQDLRVQEFPR